MEAKKNNDEIEIDLRQIFSLLWHRLFIIVLIAAACGGITYAASRFLIRPIYESSTKLYVISRANDGTTTLNDLQTSTQLTKDYKILVTSRPVTDAVIRKLGLNMSNDQLADSIAVNTPADTRVLEIVVSNHDPYIAKEIADEIADISSDTICDVMQIEKVNVIEEGNVATRPVSPNSVKNAIIGALIGFLVACAFVIIRSLLDDTIKTSEDVANYLGISTLAMIPLCEEMIDNTKTNSRNSKKEMKKRQKARAKALKEKEKADKSGVKEDVDQDEETLL